MGLKFGAKRAIHQVNQNFMSTTKINVNSANFVLSHALYRPKWILLLLDRIHYEIGLFWFRLQVMVPKMSKMIHFSNVYAEINTK